MGFQLSIFIYFSSHPFFEIFIIVAGWGASGVWMNSYTNYDVESKVRENFQSLFIFFEFSLTPHHTTIWYDLIFD